MYVQHNIVACSHNRCCHANVTIHALHIVDVYVTVNNVMNIERAVMKA
jgi:hypothetical protein